ncbi:MAG: DUF5615 family PIN-like protein [Chloroflexota bacterium]|nr:DUF5615 family PIN-like protein [Chloroflexota bacterium]
MAELRFQLDEHVPSAVATALRREGIEVVTTAEAGLLGASDIQQLAAALAAIRVIVTLDADFLQLHGRGLPHAGIAYSPGGGRAIGPLVEHLILMHEVFEVDDMMGRVEYI